MKEQFTLRIKHYLLNRLIDEAAEQRLTKYTFWERLKGDCVEVMGIEVLENLSNIKNSGLLKHSMKGGRSLSTWLIRFY